MGAKTRVPPLRSLRAFQVAGRHMSLKLAAEELFLTPSAISHQVRRLEAFLGMELFVRKTRGLEFTPAGRQYFQFLDALFARLETETRQLRSEYGRRMVRLSVPPFFANEQLLPRMKALRSLVQGVDIRLMTRPSLMKEHPADADLSVLLGADDWPELETRLLFPRRVIVAAAPELLQETGVKRYRDLDGQTLLVHEGRPHSWSNWARAVGTRPPEAAELVRFDSMSTVVQAAAQGVGFALVSWPLSEAWFRSGALERVFKRDLDTGESFWLALRPEEADREDVLRVADWLAHEFHRDA